MEGKTKICISCMKQKPLEAFARRRLDRIIYRKQCNSCRAKDYRRKYENSIRVRYTTPYPCTYPGCKLYLSSPKALEWHLAHFHLPIEEEKKRIKEIDKREKKRYGLGTGKTKGKSKGNGKKK